MFDILMSIFNKNINYYFLSLSKVHSGKKIKTQKQYLKILRFHALGEADVSQKIPYWHFDTDSKVDLLTIINGTS